MAREEITVYVYPNCKKFFIVPQYVDIIDERGNDFFRKRLGRKEFSKIRQKGKLLIHCPNCWKDVRFADCESQIITYAYTSNPGKSLPIIYYLIPIWDKGRRKGDKYLNRDEFRKYVEANIKKHVDDDDIIRDADGNIDINVHAGRFADEKIHVYPDAFEYYVEALNRGVCNTKEREIYLRKKVWWALNDIIRYAPDKLSLTPQQNETFKNNLYKLLELLDENTPSDKIVLSEIYRELGDFEKAEQLLEDIPEEYRDIKNKIKELCSNRNNKVSLTGG